MEFLSDYKPTILIFGLTGLLVWLQLALVDLFAIKQKHTPGYSIKEDHSSLLFRAHRAFANSNESIGIFVLFGLFGILSQADAQWLNLSAVAYFIGRISHMLTYYAGIRILRSIAFTISFVGLLSMFISALVMWF